MKKIILIGLIVLISGCASIPKKDYSAFYAAPPRSILIVPVVIEVLMLTRLTTSYQVLPFQLRSKAIMYSPLIWLNVS